MRNVREGKGWLYKQTTVRTRLVFLCLWFVEICIEDRSIWSGGFSVHLEGRNLKNKKCRGSFVHLFIHSYSISWRRIFFYSSSSSNPAVAVEFLVWKVCHLILKFLASYWNRNVDQWFSLFEFTYFIIYPPCVLNLPINFYIDQQNPYMTNSKH